MDEGGENIGWTRDCVNVRLTKERVAKLRALAEDVGRDATPTDALDLALELAVATRRQDADRESAGDDAERFRAAVEKLADVGAANARAHASGLASLAGELRGLSELISAVAAAAGGSDDGFDEPATLRAWLDTQSRSTSDAPISARARWQSKTYEGEGRVGLELLVRRTPSPGERRAVAGLASVVKLTSLDAAGPFARTDLISDFLLECRRGPDGSWIVARHQATPAGLAGPLLGTIRA